MIQIPCCPRQQRQKYAHYHAVKKMYKDKFYSNPGEQEEVHAVCLPPPGSTTCPHTDSSPFERGIIKVYMRIDT